MLPVGVPDWTDVHAGEAPAHIAVPRLAFAVHNEVGREGVTRVLGTLRQPDKGVVDVVIRAPVEHVHRTIAPEGAPQEEHSTSPLEDAPHESRELAALVVGLVVVLARDDDPVGVLHVSVELEERGLRRTEKLLHARTVVVDVRVGDLNNLARLAIGPLDEQVVVGREDGPTEDPGDAAALLRHLRKGVLHRPLAELPFDRLEEDVAPAAAARAHLLLQERRRVLVLALLEKPLELLLAVGVSARHPPEQRAPPPVVELGEPRADEGDEPLPPSKLENLVQKGAVVLVHPLDDGIAARVRLPTQLLDGHGTHVCPHSLN